MSWETVYEKLRYSLKMIELVLNTTSYTLGEYYF